MFQIGDDVMKAKICLYYYSVDDGNLYYVIYF